MTIKPTDVLNDPIEPLAILGGGPVGLALALLLARRNVPSIVFDARSIEQARTDRRLLALSLGSLQTLRTLIELPPAAWAPIRTVIVSSVGEFGRAIIDEKDANSEMLGATIRYGDLIAALSAAVESSELITVHRAVRVVAVRQSPSQVHIDLDPHEPVSAPLALSAEGFGSGVVDTASASHSALIADVEAAGVQQGEAFERFTREGPLALLPLPTRGASDVQRMGLVWCMTRTQADRRSALSDAEFIDELREQLGQRGARVSAISSRSRHALHEKARNDLVEHRIVYLGNAAQTLHPVAGQGLNLGLRDGALLAEKIGAAYGSGSDVMPALHAYAQSRQIDRAAMVALTRAAPAFFATRFAPVALARSIGLTAMGVVPNLRREFARLLMFGVRF